MDPRVQLLTKREIELLHHVFLGRKTAEIAALEGIAPQTVLNRLQEGRAKLGGVDRRRAALIVAEAKGWVPGIKPPVPNQSFAPPKADRDLPFGSAVSIEPETPLPAPTLLSPPVPPGIKPTAARNTLPDEPLSPATGPVSHGEWRTAPGERASDPEGGVFVQTLTPEPPAPMPARRNEHDMLARVSMLLVRTAFLVAATVALLWVYGRA